MKTVHAKSWHAGSTGNHQGIVIDEETGRTVAVTHDAKDGPLVAAAPELLDALRALCDFANAALSGTIHDDTLHVYESKARAAIERAEGQLGR